MEVSSEAGPLSTGQRSIAEADASARIVVTAGPGAGKTHTLICRLVHLVQGHGLAGGSEILLLSFSRSAVRALKDRTALLGSDAAYVRARTFDSLATRLLSDIDPDGTWATSGYDERIRRATQSLRDDPSAVRFVGDYQHVIVDEIQDLVGVRDQFVRQILKTVNRGFTLFGDPAQGIYNFQLSDAEERRLGSSVLYGWLPTQFPELRRIGLTENYRARTSEACVALQFGLDLNEPKPDYQEISRRLTNVLGALDSVGTVETAAPILARTSAPTAILCHTNGEALRISSTLSKLEVPHRLQRRAVDRAVVPWLAEVAMSVSDSVVPRVVLQPEIERFAPSYGVDPDEAWRLLKRLGPKSDRRNSNVDLRDVAARVRRGDVPDELDFQPPTNLVVSTIHRAKGLEFDRVVVVETGRRPTTSDEVAESARTLFVALTRPRDELLHMKPVDTRNMRTFGSDDRWIVVGYKSWMRLGVEVRGDDVDRHEPPGAESSPTEAGETQTYLRSELSIGDPVELVRVIPRFETKEPPRFAVRHGGRVVGRTSAEFGVGLATMLHSAWSNSRLPDSIEGIFVEGLDTVAGHIGAGREAGLGPSGLWLRPRVAGLGRFHFDKEEAGKR